MPERYVGLISGTSVDGVDAVLLDLEGGSPSVVAAATTPYPADLAARVGALIDAPQTSLRDLGRLDAALGAFFADCALAVVASAGLTPAAVEAIGHHGQTVYHEPVPPEPFTLQLGDPNVVAARTGITTVADFRRLDVALGGQGAPLVCAFHAASFAAANEARVVLNLGGIANITVLRPEAAVTGFDTGPSNTLLDRWAERHLGRRYDADGAWAASGVPDEGLLERLLDEPYFRAPAPKSTGRELFNSGWLDARLGALGRAVAPVDVQATLAELTARTVAAAIEQAAPDCARVVVCGGGAHNGDLLARLGRATGLGIERTDAYGVGADWVEGAAFAWLARARLKGEPGNVPTVTGARQAAILGGVYSGPSPHAREQRLGQWTP